MPISDYRIPTRQDAAILQDMANRVYGGRTTQRPLARRRRTGGGGAAQSVTVGQGILYGASVPAAVWDKSEPNGKVLMPGHDPLAYVILLVKEDPAEDDDEPWMKLNPAGTQLPVLNLTQGVVDLSVPHNHVSGFVASSTTKLFPPWETLTTYYAGAEVSAEEMDPADTENFGKTFNWRANGLRSNIAVWDLAEQQNWTRLVMTGLTKSWFWITNTLRASVVHATADSAVGAGDLTFTATVTTIEIGCSPVDLNDDPTNTLASVKNPFGFAIDAGGLVRCVHSDDGDWIAVQAQCPTG